MTDMPDWRRWADHEYHFLTKAKNRPMEKRLCPHCGKEKFCTARTMRNHRWRCKKLQAAKGAKCHAA